MYGAGRIRVKDISQLTRSPTLEDLLRLNIEYFNPDAVSPNDVQTAPQNNNNNTSVQLNSPEPSLEINLRRRFNELRQSRPSILSYGSVAKPNVTTSVTGSVVKEPASQTAYSSAILSQNAPTATPAGPEPIASAVVPVPKRGRKAGKGPSPSPRVKRVATSISATRKADAPSYTTQYVNGNSNFINSSTSITLVRGKNSSCRDNYGKDKPQDFINGAPNDNIIGIDIFNEHTFENGDSPRSDSIPQINSCFSLSNLREYPSGPVVPSPPPPYSPREDAGPSSIPPPYTPTNLSAHHSTSDVNRKNVGVIPLIPVDKNNPNVFYYGQNKQSQIVIQKPVNNNIGNSRSANTGNIRRVYSNNRGNKPDTHPQNLEIAITANIIGLSPQNVENAITANVIGPRPQNVENAMSANIIGPRPQGRPPPPYPTTFNKNNNVVLNPIKGYRIRHNDPRFDSLSMASRTSEPLRPVLATPTVLAAPTLNFGKHVAAGSVDTHIQVIDLSTTPNTSPQKKLLLEKKVHKAKKKSSKPKKKESQESVQQKSHFVPIHTYSNSLQNKDGLGNNVTAPGERIPPISIKNLLKKAEFDSRTNEAVRRDSLNQVFYDLSKQNTDTTKNQDDGCSSLPSLAKSDQTSPHLLKKCRVVLERLPEDLLRLLNKIDEKIRNKNEVVSDMVKRNIVPDNRNKDLVAEKRKNDVVAEKSENETVAEKRKNDIVAEKSKNDIVVDKVNKTIVPESVSNEFKKDVSEPLSSTEPSCTKEKIVEGINSAPSVNSVSQLEKVLLEFSAKSHALCSKCGRMLPKIFFWINAATQDIVCRYCFLKASAEIEKKLSLPVPPVVVLDTENNVNVKSETTVEPAPSVPSNTRRLSCKLQKAIKPSENKRKYKKHSVKKFKRIRLGSTSSESSSSTSSSSESSSSSDEDSPLA